MTDTDRAYSALHSLDPSCNREEWVKIGMAAKSAGLTFNEWHSWSADGSSYENERSCLSVWKSINEAGGISEKSLFKMALANGWCENNDRLGLPLTKQKIIAQNAVKQAATPNVSVIWERCIAATTAEPYIYRKHGKPDGLRVYPAAAPKLIIRGHDVVGYLVVPCWSGSELQTLQFIPPESGDKLNLPGASFNDGFFTVGELTDRVYICEGIGQAWACNSATGAAAIVCFGAGRMMTVAKALRAKYPAARLVVVPDRGKEEQAATIAAAVAGQWIEMPEDKPSNYDANDYAAEHGSGALAAMLERPQASPMRYRLLTDSDLAALPPLQWRIKGVLPETGLAAVFGASGSGKSFLVLDALQSLAAGADWFGHRVKSCPVIYCALEGEGGIAGRVNAYRIWHGSTAGNIRYLVQSFDLLDSGDVQDLAQAIKADGNGVGVVVLDTLNRAAPGADENDSKSMGQIIAAAKQLQTLVGGLVLLVHHTGKDASKGLRGHSSLHAALDAAIEVRRDGDRREWLIAKSKDGEDGATHPFKLDVVELGTDEDGEPVTSCVIHPLEKSAEVLRRPLPPKSGNQRVVWDALGEIFRQAGNVNPEGAPDTLPQGRPCITLAAAIEQTRTRLVCDPKRQTERAQAAIRGLVDRGILCHERGFVWCK